MAMVAFRAAATTTASARPPLPKPQEQQQQQQQYQQKLLHIKPALPPRTPAALSLVAVLSATAGSEAKAFSLPKDDIISSLNKAEDAIAQASEVLYAVFAFSQDAYKMLAETLKPGVDAALPILQSASEVAVKAASPVVSDASKQAKEALQSAGIDPSPFFSAAQNCWVVADGFSGRKGWLQSRLGADSYNVSIVEVISPSKVIPAAATRFGTTSSAALQTTRKLLPGSIDN